MNKRVQNELRRVHAGQNALADMYSYESVPGKSEFTFFIRQQGDPRKPLGPDSAPPFVFHCPTNGRTWKDPKEMCASMLDTKDPFKSTPWQFMINTRTGKSLTHHRNKANGASKSDGKDDDQDDAPKHKSKANSKSNSNSNSKSKSKSKSKPSSASVPVCAAASNLDAHDTPMADKAVAELLGSVRELIRCVARLTSTSTSGTGHVAAPCASTSANASASEQSPKPLVSQLVRRAREPPANHAAPSASDQNELSSDDDVELDNSGCVRGYLPGSESVEQSGDDKEEDEGDDVDEHGNVVGLIASESESDDASMKDASDVDDDDDEFEPHDDKEDEDDDDEDENDEGDEVGSSDDDEKALEAELERLRQRNSKKRKRPTDNDDKPAPPPQMRDSAKYARPVTDFKDKKRVKLHVPSPPKKTIPPLKPKPKTPSAPQRPPGKKLPPHTDVSNAAKPVAVAAPNVLSPGMSDTDLLSTLFPQ